MHLCLEWLRVRLQEESRKKSLSIGCSLHIVSKQNIQIMSSSSGIFSCIFFPSSQTQQCGVQSQGHFYRRAVIHTFLQTIALVHHKFGSFFCLYSIRKWLLSSGEEATEDVFAIGHREGNLSLAKPAATFFYALSYKAYSYTKKYRQIDYIPYISC